jgi:hypothetical protein
MSNQRLQLIGKRFGKLSVIAEAGIEEYSGGTMFLCECECGNKKILKGGDLTAGRRKSCGKCPRINVHKKNLEMIGKTFNNLTVIGVSKTESGVGLCLCTCGNAVNLHLMEVRSGKIVSCGCVENRIKTKKSNKSSAKHLYGLYKVQANKRGLSFSLSIEEFEELIQQPCHYCGAEPFQICIRRTKQYQSIPYIYNGVDRVDNSIGYEMGNCTPCCGICNRVKNDTTVEDFILRVDNIYNNLNKKGLLIYE